MSEPNIVLESSSDGEDTISTVNTGRPFTPDSQCSICLDKLTHPSHPDSCLHLFCFDCLRQWSNMTRFCPLCKETFTYINLTFEDLGVNKKDDLPRRLQVYEINVDDDSEYEHILRTVQSILCRLQRLLYSENGASQILFSISKTPIIGQAMRRQVYVHNLWAEPLQETIGHIRDCSADFNRDNPAHAHRVHKFILRDLFAIRESLILDGQAMPLNRETIITMSSFIMRSLLTREISQLNLVIALRSIILDAHVFHFCHELLNFANSRCAISDYDRHVQFTYRPGVIESTEQSPIETIVLNSDNEEVQRPTIITDVSSSTDDSDVVILSNSIGSIEPLHSASIDQPSTSTAIQDSLNQPNNSFQSVDGGSSPYPSRIKSGMPNHDSLSDYENSIIAIRPSKTAYKRSRDNHNKVNRNKIRKINTNDSGSEIHGTNRNHSYSGSSSTSGETDTNSYSTDIVL